MNKYIWLLKTHMILIYLFLSGPLFFLTIQNLVVHPSTDCPKPLGWIFPARRNLKILGYGSVISVISLSSEKSVKEGLILSAAPTIHEWKSSPNQLQIPKNCLLSFTPREHPNFHHLCSQVPNSLPDLLNTLVSFLINFFFSNFLIKFDNSIDFL